MESFLTISWTNIKSALVSGIIMAVLAMGTYIIGVSDVYQIETHALVNAGVMGLLTTIVSLIKSLLTTSQGNFLGTVKVAEKK